MTKYEYKKKKLEIDRMKKWETERIGLWENERLRKSAIENLVNINKMTTF